MEKSEDSAPEEGRKSQDTSSDVDDNEASSRTFHRLSKRLKRRSYRRKTSGAGEDPNASSSSTDDSSSAVDESNRAGTSSAACPKLRKLFTDNKDHIYLFEEGNEAASREDDSDTESEANNDQREEGETDAWASMACAMENKEHLQLLKTIKPKYTFSAVSEMMHRQIGQSKHFQRKFYGSLHTVERLQFLHSLNEHEGCVNTVEFNESGNLLASGSDDLAVCIWNWATGKKRNSYDSGHRNNIFQASWLPCDSTMMVTCASDGQVRLLDLVRGSSRNLALHMGACNKFAIHPETPHVAISVGDDGKVLSIDVREDEATKLVVVKGVSWPASTVQLYTIHSNPRNSHEFCVGGRSESVRIFDRRKASSPISKLCPTKMIDVRVHVTAVTYNYNGTEILASYNDDDIYLFDTLIPHPNGDYAHKYQGHRNSRTIKGVNFFGPNSEFIVSGSDCGNIFFWEKNSEVIVQCVPGDKQGVVNCVKPHPTVPVLASSGLDNDVKIWVPSAIGPPSLTELKKCAISNLFRREEPRRYNNIHNMFRLILEQFRRNRRRTGGAFYADDDEDDDDDDDDDDD